MPIFFPKMLSCYLVLFTCTFCAVSAQDTLKVMTYNIYHGEQGYAAGESNLEDIAELIDRIDPDFVALQEVDSMTARSAGLNDGEPLNQVEALAEMTGMHGYFGKAIEYDGGGYGEGILSREPLQPRKWMLPIPEGGEDRALLALKSSTESGRTVWFAGTHLCHQYPKNRMAQMKEINKVVREMDNAVILGGDFNFGPDEAPYAEVRKQWIDIAKTNTDSQPEYTFSFDDPSKRIDYLFLTKENGWNVLDVEVLKVDHSDHLPVVATVVLD